MNSTLRKVGIAALLLFASAIALHAQPEQFSPSQIKWPTGAPGCVFAPGSIACVPPGTTPLNGLVETGNYTVTSASFIQMNCASPCTVTLPATVSTGFSVAIERIGVGSVAINPNGVAYDGATSIPLQYEFVTVWTDGTGYHSNAPLNIDSSLLMTPGPTVNLLSVAAGGSAAICSDTSGSPTAQSCTIAGFTLSAPKCFTYTTTTPNAAGSFTLNVNGGGAKPVAKWLGTTTLAAGDVPAGKAETACYDGTNINLMTVGNAPGGGSGGSTHVLYASQISGATPGVAVTAGSSATGTTDSASALNTAISAGNVDLEVDSGFALSTSLVLASNTTIHCTAPQNGFIMQPSANTPVLVNAHQSAPTTSSGTGGYLVSNITDTNIKVVGCMLNANSAQAVTGAGNPDGTAHTTNASGLLVNGIRFAGVAGLQIERNETYDSGEWSISLANVTNASVDENYVHQPSPLIQRKNTDGIAIGGPSSYVEIEGNIVNAGDDSITLGAEGCVRSGETDCGWSFWKWGPIQHAHIEHNTLNSDYGVRLLDGSELIDDVDIGDTEGSVCGNSLTMLPFGSFGNGNLGRVNVHGWKVQTSGTCNNYSQPYNFELGLNAQDIEISDVEYANPAVNWPILTVLGPGTIQTLNLHGWDITTISSTFSDVVMMSGAVTHLIASNMAWDDTVGTGAFFAGATSPSTFTCSNFVGRGLFGSGFGYSGSTENGDCFPAASTNGTANANPASVNFTPSTADAAGLHVTPSNPSGNSEKFEITGTPLSAIWPPSAPAPTFSPAAGGVSSGTTITTSCPGSATPWVSTGTSPVAGATGISVTPPQTIYGSCQGGGYFTTGTASYTLGYSIANSTYINGQSGSTVALPAFSSPLTANSTIVVLQEYNSVSAFSAPTDTAGNTYSDCGGGQTNWNANSTSAQCWYAVNTHTTASNVVTMHFPSSTSGEYGVAIEVTGAHATSPIDGGSGVGFSTKANSTGGSAGANTLSGTAITTASNGDLVLGMFLTNLSIASPGTSPNAFARASNPSGWLIEYFMQPTAASITVTAGDASNSDPYAALVVALRQ